MQFKKFTVRFYMHFPFCKKNRNSEPVLGSCALALLFKKARSYTSEFYSLDN